MTGGVDVVDVDDVFSFGGDISAGGGSAGPAPSVSSGIPTRYTVAVLHGVCICKR